LDHDYNQNGEYEAEQNITNGSFDPDKNGSEKREQYKEHWSQPENVKLSEESGESDVNGPEAVYQNVINKTPDRESGSDRRERRSSGSRNDRYRDSRNSNDRGRFGPPIILDLDGDGVELTSLDESSVFYDISGDGYRNRMGWAGKDDGILAFDKDSDGVIKDRDEIAFVDYTQGAETDLEGLTAFDSNNDGVLDKRDDKWKQFGVWQDKDQDGETDIGEFASMQNMGISSIDLSSDQNQHKSSGNVIYGLGNYTRSDGSTHTFADTALQYSDFSFRKASDGSIDIQTDGVGIKLLSDDIDNRLSLSGENTHVVIGGVRNDAISTDGSHDVMFDGGNGNDQLHGGDGDDWLIGGEGTDYVHGGAGNDYLFVDNQDDWHGGDGYDTAIILTDQNLALDLTQHSVESVITGAGNDRITAGGENNIISSGDGRDIIITGGGADTILAGAGNDVINAGDGADFISGGLGRDSLIGGEGNDQLYGEQGDDLLIGVAGNNLLMAGSGNDRLKGGINADVLIGGSGNDFLYGNEGDDHLIGGQGNDRLYGGDGSNTYYFASGDGQDEIYNFDTEGNDTLTFDGVATESIWFERNGLNLDVKILGSTDEVSIRGWYKNETSKIDQFTNSDGSTLAENQVNKLVEVMAGYQANDGSSFESIRPGSLPHKVQLAVDSAWRAA
jgi:Ca2+-binding RTX toxin-like protein